jgi:TolB-like protein
METMSELWERLRHRKTVQWALAYLAGAWLLLQLVSLLAEPFGWPAFVVRATTVLLAVGFFGALVLAWYHGEKGEQRISSIELLMLASILTIAGSAVAWVSGDVLPGMSVEGAGSAQASAADVRSLAVLPFENLSDSKENEYFSDGVTEEILNALAQVPGLHVAGRYSSFAFKGKDTPMAQISRQLRVGAVLEGSIRREGNQVRVTAHLLNASTGDQLWTESYDGEVSAMLAVQERIARSIVSALRVRLGANEMVMRGSTSPEAYDLYLRGLYEWRKRGQEGQNAAEVVRAAIAYLTQAVALDSSSAVAYAGLSRVYEVAHLYLPDVPVAAGLRAADAAARRAVALDSTLADAHSVLAWTLAYLHRDYAAAEREHLRAIQLKPNDVWIRWSYSTFLHFVGRSAEGIREAELAIAQDPGVLAAYNSAAENYAMAGRYSEAEDAYLARHVRAGLNPGYAGLIQLVYVPQGRLQEARAALGKAGGPRLSGAAAYLEAAAGRPVEARRLLAQLNSYPDVYQFSAALVNSTLGQRDSAFVWLDRLADAPGLSYTDSPFDPRLASLHRDPRWQAFLRKLRLR